MKHCKQTTVLVLILQIGFSHYTDSSYLPSSGHTGTRTRTDKPHSHYKASSYLPSGGHTSASAPMDKPPILKPDNLKTQNGENISFELLDVLKLNDAFKQINGDSGNAVNSDINGQVGNLKGKYILLINLIKQGGRSIADEDVRRPLYNLNQKRMINQGNDNSGTYSSDTNGVQVNDPTQRTVMSTANRGEQNNWHPKDKDIVKIARDNSANDQNVNKPSFEPRPSTNTNTNSHAKLRDTTKLTDNPPVSKRTLNADSTCSMDTVQTALTFSENREIGGGTVLVVCRGNVMVNKCEGLCYSKVWPSVNHNDGYEKECTCCRNVSNRQRDITLSNCSVDSTSITRTIVEPSSCSCLECRG